MSDFAADSAAPDEPATQRRINSAARILAGHHEDAVRILSRLDADELAHVGESVLQIQRERAIAAGDQDHIIDEAFETAFGGDGLGASPWIEGDLIVAPGCIINKSRTSHRCRFVSVNDTWVWDSIEVIREDKRSLPGDANNGFQSVALLPVLNGMALDVVSGKARSGQHSVDNVSSYTVRRNKLVEVAQRSRSARNMR